MLEVPSYQFLIANNDCQLVIKDRYILMMCGTPSLFGVGGTLLEYTQVSSQRTTIEKFYFNQKLQSRLQFGL